MSTLAVKYCITFVEATGSPDARLNSLKGGGPLKLDPEHLFAVKLGLSPTAGGWVEITYREVEFIIGKAFVISDQAFLDNHVVWVVDVIRCTQLVADADAGGKLDWDSPSGNIEELRTEFQEAVRCLPDAMRTLDVDESGVIRAKDADMSKDWLARISPRALIRGESNSEMQWQFRSCVAYFLTKNERDHDEDYTPT